MRYFEKIGKKEIIGIPDKSVKTPLPSALPTTTWEFVIQRHVADKAGEHFDLRLGPGFSWAGRRLPEPGGKELFIRQPDHSPDYFDFEGKIEEGYGKGTVSQEARGKVEVVKSEPTKVTFHFYDGTKTVKYTLLNLSGDDWLLINHTNVSKEIQKLMPEPLKYKSGVVEGGVETPKIDGASSVLILRSNKIPQVFSRRTSKRTGDLIEYTPKIPSLYSTLSPKELGTTVLRTEVYGVTPDYKELPNRALSGILNAGVLKSREMQKSVGSPLRLAAYDVVRYKGKNVSNLPFEEKQLIIKNIRTKFPYIDIPSEVAEKVNFKEGKVVWKDNIPYKVKNIEDYDVTVKNIFPSTNISRAGGFEYSIDSDSNTIVGKVGTGFTHKELKDMKRYPEKYIGRVAKLIAQEQHPSGALRAPSFKGWHVDKNL